jgi:hypothetical protein
MSSLRRLLLALGLAALGAVHSSAGARAEDEPTVQRPPGTWVYDVRVVRIDPSAAAVLEAAPTWNSVDPAGAVTTATWGDLLGSLKQRGRATILLDQRVTAIEGARSEFGQWRKRPVLSLQHRATGVETWSASYVETQTSGELLSGRGGSLEYRVRATWEEAPKGEGTGPLGEVTWKGSRMGFASGETLVLSHRHQQVPEAVPPQGLEIYVFVTGSLLPPR